MSLAILRYMTLSEDGPANAEFGSKQNLTFSPETENGGFVPTIRRSDPCRSVSGSLRPPESGHRSTDYLMSGTGELFDVRKAFQT